MNYYNDNAPYAAEYLRCLVRDKQLPPGDVDDRSIVDVDPADLKGYTQCHFFAGLGGWVYALEIAKWPADRPVWTGSCPCPPFSRASRAAKSRQCNHCSKKTLIPNPLRTGVFSCWECGADQFRDERHLWPDFHRLIRKCNPPIVFGEQVAGEDGEIWFSGVQATLAQSRYASTAEVIPARSVGTPHQRERLWWVAVRDTALGKIPQTLDPSSLGHARWWEREPALSGSQDGASTFWANRTQIWKDIHGFEFRCKPGISPMVDGLSRNLDIIRAFGNAIVPQVAAEFVEATKETLGIEGQKERAFSFDAEMILVGEDDKTMTVRFHGDKSMKIPKTDIKQTGDWFQVSDKYTQKLNLKKRLKERDKRFIAERKADERRMKNRQAQTKSRDNKKARAVSPKRNYKPKTKAYPLQAKALRKMDSMTNFALFSEQGTGKSKVAIDRLGSLWGEGKIDKAIIVAPKGVHRQWVEEQFPLHFGGNYSAQWWNGKSIGPAAEFNKHLPVFTINYDALRTKAGMTAANSFLGRDRYALVLDESHNVKNRRSQRWKACRLLAEKNGCRYRMLLTGTPIARDLTDEWAQFYILDPDIIGIKYVTSFRAEYCRMGGFMGRQVMGARNIDQFKKLTEPYIFRATKKDLGIAAKQYTRWHFDMSAAQKKQYDDFKDTLLMEIANEEITASNALTRMLRLQQISNGFIQGDDGVHPLFDKVSSIPRIQALTEMMDAEEDDTPVIIWCRFQQDISNVFKALGGAERCLTYHGKMNSRDRKASIDNWLSQKYNQRFLIATPSSGGTGLNLQGACTRAIYYSNSFNSIDRWQSEDRIHRIGTKGVVTYVDLICRGTIDAAILSNLREKKNLSSLTLDQVRAMLEVDDHDKMWWEHAAITGSPK